jgi:putative protease
LDLPKGRDGPPPRGRGLFGGSSGAGVAPYRDGLRQELGEGRKSAEIRLLPTLPKPLKAKGAKGKPREMDVWRALPHRLGNQANSRVGFHPWRPSGLFQKYLWSFGWWLPPVIWPGEEKEWVTA